MTAKSAKAKKASKSGSKFERQKHKALERLYKKASSQKTSSLGRHGLQLSPEGQGEREASLSPTFPIDTSGIWGSAQVLQSPLPTRGYDQQPDTERVDSGVPSTSAGSCPDQSNPLGMPNFQDIIAEAIKQGIAADLQQKVARAPEGTSVHSTEPRETNPPVGSLSPAYSQDDQSSVSEEGEIREANLSADEGMAPEQPAFSGLFQPSLLKSLLFKAKTSGNFRTKSLAAAVRPQTVSAETIFSVQTTKAETVPTPKIFVDLVQRQWASTTSGPMPSSTDKKVLQCGQ